MKRYVALLMTVVMGLTGLMQYHHHDVLGHIFIHLTVCHEYDFSHNHSGTTHHSHDEDCPLHLKECTEGKISSSTLADNFHSEALVSDITCVSEYEGCIALCSYSFDCSCAICSTLADCQVLRGPPAIA